jgi:hypothetical protein
MQSEGLATFVVPAIFIGMVLLFLAALFAISTLFDKQRKSQLNGFANLVTNLGFKMNEPSTSPLWFAPFQQIPLPNNSSSKITMLASARFDDIEVCVGISRMISHRGSYEHVFCVARRFHFGGPSFHMRQRIGLVDEIGDFIDHSYIDFEDDPEFSKSFAVQHISGEIHQTLKSHFTAAHRTQFSKIRSDFIEVRSNVVFIRKRIGPYPLPTWEFPNLSNDAVFIAKTWLTTPETDPNFSSPNAHTVGTVTR